MTCTYDPRELAGLPIGMFHCPECGEMVLAGMEHPLPQEELEKDPHYYDRLIISNERARIREWAEKRLNSIYRYELGESDTLRLLLDFLKEKE